MNGGFTLPLLTDFLLLSEMLSDAQTFREFNCWLNIPKSLNPTKCFTQELHRPLEIIYQL